MRSMIRNVALAAMALVALCGAAFGQQDGAAKGAPPAGFVAPADPKPDENNAQRGKSQPGNNAPFWRAVRESGNVQGSTTLPAVEAGSLK